MYGLVDESCTFVVGRQRFVAGMKTFVAEGHKFAAGMKTFVAEGQTFVGGMGAFLAGGPTFELERQTFGVVRKQFVSSRMFDKGW